MAAGVTTDHLTTYFLSLTLGKRRAARGPRLSDGPGGPVNRRQRRNCSPGNTRRCPHRKIAQNASCRFLGLSTFSVPTHQGVCLNISHAVYSTHVQTATPRAALALGRLIQTRSTGVSRRCHRWLWLRAGRGAVGWTASCSQTLEGRRPWVYELVEDVRGDTYRVAYTVRFAKAVYVLHCFQKKSPSGIRTARKDVELIHERLKLARQDYEVRYGHDE